MIVFPEQKSGLNILFVCIKASNNKYKTMAVELIKIMTRYEAATREHEKEIVIDLSIDRSITFIGTYLIGSLTIATAIFVIVGKSH